jgi:hypothetical protein
MSAVFLKLLNLSITASWLIMAVILVRFLLKKAPKWITCVLWALVAIWCLLLQKQRQKLLVQKKSIVMIVDLLIVN